MPATFLYTTKGYRSGAWSAAATDLKVANSANSFNSLETLKTAAFYRTATGWRRFYTYNEIPDSALLVIGYSVTAPATVTAAIAVNSNGSVNTYSSPGIGWLGRGDWDKPKHPDSEMQIYAELISNTASVTGTFGSWLALTSNREWSLSKNVNETLEEAVIKLTIRHEPSSTNVLSSNVTLQISSGSI